ncbi:MAG: hypothetical protein HYR72_27185 [Deltaproteobacteria bacterium]|nr:hypothetical protein [Deltaproteobacteria bacterium]MBI3390300.1 hypothetical protein [Deltaproteobacteria bacterium]
MRRQRERVGFMRQALMVAGALGLLAGVAGADVTTERSASIVVFPKVITTSTRDTIIQLTNTNNSMVHAHCYYINGALADPNSPQIPGINDPVWNELDFDIWLTKQQPTVWVASTGREADPTDNSTSCADSNGSCYGVGLDPGFVPPTAEDFTGELRCIEVDATGQPVGGDHLKGEATLVNTDTGDVAKYNGIGILHNSGVEIDTDNVLCLGDSGPDICPSGAEYNACPDIWILNHFADGAADPIADDESPEVNNVGTELTIVPCTEDLENKKAASVVIQFSVTNEFETSFSASTTVTCWENADLADINEQAFGRVALTTDFAQTRIRAVGTGGVLMVAEEFHQVQINTSDDIHTASAAFNPHIEDNPDSARSDTITFQPDLVVPEP